MGTENDSIAEAFNPGSGTADATTPVVKYDSEKGSYKPVNAPQEMGQSGHTPGQPHNPNPMTVKRG